MFFRTIAALGFLAVGAAVADNPPFYIQFASDNAAIDGHYVRARHRTDLPYGSILVRSSDYATTFALNSTGQLYMTEGNPTEYGATAAMVAEGRVYFADKHVITTDAGKSLTGLKCSMQTTEAGDAELSCSSAGLSNNYACMGRVATKNARESSGWYLGGAPIKGTAKCGTVTVKVVPAEMIKAK